MSNFINWKHNSASFDILKLFELFAIWQLGAIQVLRNAFFWKLDPHPPS